MIAINVCRHDGIKYGALHLQGDAQRTLDELSRELEPPTDDAWRRRIAELAREWRAAVDRATADDGTDRPSDAQVLGAVNRWIGPEGTVVCAAGGLPGELHKLWRAQDADAYHVEYGYSCMGYEIAGGLGVKLARPEREVVVLVGDGSYLMMNSEIATSIALGLKLDDRRARQPRLRLHQPPAAACGGESFNNLLDEPERRRRRSTSPRTRARSARVAEKVDGHRRAASSARPLTRARQRTAVIVIETDPARAHGGRRRLVGRRRWPKCRRAQRCSDARREYRAPRSPRRA